jgi:hypothetical protein
MKWEDLRSLCTTEYTIAAFAPAVHCGWIDGSGFELPDDRLCDPKPRPDEGIPFGSGIDPRFETYCDPELLHCFPKAPPPGW